MGVVGDLPVVYKESDTLVHTGTEEGISVEGRALYRVYRTMVGVVGDLPVVYYSLIHWFIQALRKAFLWKGEHSSEYTGPWWGL